MTRRSLLRVMLAEDFLPWRRYLISRLQDEPDLEIVRVAADRLEAIQKAEVLRGVYKRPVKITFGEFGERYMEYAKTNKRSWLRDQQMLEHLTGFFGNERQLTDLTTLDIEGYKVRRRSSVSGSMVNRELALLKHYVPSRNRLGSVHGPQPRPPCEILSGIQHRHAGCQLGTGRETHPERSTIPSGPDSI